MKKRLFNIFLIIILVLACVVRIYAYFSARELDPDEFMLLSNLLHRDMLTLFLPLSKTQSSPPLFLVINKMLSYIVFPAEYILRLPSLIYGLCSVFLFYKLSRKIFTKNSLVLISNFLFAVNIRLVFYSQEFKQYSLEMMLGLAFILFFANLDLKEKLSYKKALLYGILMFIPFLFSIPYIFILFAFLIYSFVEQTQSRKYILISCIPFTILFLIYYLINLHPSQVQMLSISAEFWKSSFITLNLNEILGLIKYNYNYFWGGEKFALLHFFMISLGVFFLAKQKNRINILMILSLFLAMLVSFIHLYPFRERIILYLVPYFIIFSIAVFEFISLRKKPIVYSFLALCLILSYSSYNYKFFKSLFGTYVTYQPIYTVESKYPLQYIKDHYQYNDIIIYNDASQDALMYNAKLLNWDTLGVKSVKIQLSDYSKEFYFKTLDQLFAYLKDYKVFYFYYPMDFSTRRVIPFIESWLKANGHKYNYHYASYYKTKDQLFIKLVKNN